LRGWRTRLERRRRRGGGERKREGTRGKLRC
jgi:hypothetical protein